MEPIYYILAVIIILQAGFLFKRYLFKYYVSDTYLKNIFKDLYNDKKFPAFLLESNGSIKAINGQAEKEWGFTEKQYLEKPIQDFLPDIVSAATLYLLDKMKGRDYALIATEEDVNTKAKIITMAKTKVLDDNDYAILVSIYDEDILPRIYNNMLDKCKELEDINCNIQKELSNTKIDNEKQTKELNENKESIQELQNKYQEEMNKKNEYKEKYQEIKIKYENLNEENNKLIEVNKNLLYENEESINEKTKLKEECIVLEKEIKILQEIRKNLDIKYFELQREYNNNNKKQLIDFNTFSMKNKQKNQDNASENNKNNAEIQPNTDENQINIAENQTNADEIQTNIGKIQTNIDEKEPNNTIIKFKNEGINNAKSITEINSKIRDDLIAKDAKILLVEDNKVNSKVAGMLITKLGAIVDYAANGQEAVEKCQNNFYDIVFMDCNMPVLDGYQAATEIRKLPEPNGKVLIIALTANDTPENRSMCEQAGMDDYFLKPFSLSSLKQMVKKYFKPKNG